MNAYTSRLVAMALLFCGTFVAGTAPIYFIRKLKKKHDSIKEGPLSRYGGYIISVMVCFGGGVLFATCFVHLMPEVRGHFRVQVRQMASDNVTLSMSKESARQKHIFPKAELLICTGFFIVYFVEEAIHAALKHIHSRKSGRTSEIVTMHGHSHSPKVMLCATRDPDARQSFSREPATTAGTRSSLKQQTKANPTVYGSTSPIVEPDATDHVPVANVPLSVKGLLIVVALSFHSVFEGLAIGLQSTSKDVWTMFIAVSMHKFVISFVMSLELYAKGHSRAIVVVIYMTVFSCMSPVGILVGLFTEVAISGNDNVIVGYLTALATGTLLYVTFFEILQMEKNSEVPGLVQFLAVVLGFALMAFLTFYLPA